MRTGTTWTTWTTVLTRSVAAALLLAAASLPASAKPPERDAKKVAPPGTHLRYAHSWEAAMAEAKNRGCVVFATFHKDG